MGTYLTIAVTLVAMSAFAASAQQQRCTENSDCLAGFSCPAGSFCCTDVGHCVADGMATSTSCPCAPPSFTPFLGTPTAAETPAPTFNIGGCVVHYSGCGGSQEFGTVTLNPLGRRAMVDHGFFAFGNVPPGEYTLAYSPACNPAGCTGTVGVRIVDQDGYAAFQRSACVADCSVNHRVTVEEVVFCINAALGNSSGCIHCDPNRNGQVAVDELLRAVDAALNGCR